MLPVKQIETKLMESLVVSRRHMVEFQWRNTMRSIDATLSDSNFHQLICTNFGATLNLSKKESNTCYTENNSTVCIFFINNNWRNVNYKREGENKTELDDVTIINDCHKWAFFGCIISKGNKNHHFFHEFVYHLH